MQKKILLTFIFCFLILPVIADNWLPIPGTNISYDKNSIEYGDFGVVRILTKTPADDSHETRPQIAINCNTRRYSVGEIKLYNIYKQKYVYREFPEPNWQNIPQNSNLRYLYNDVCHE